VALAVALGIAAPGGARAEQCAAIDGGSDALAQRSAEERIAAIQAGLRIGARHARAWAWSWAAIYSVATAGEVVSAVLRDTSTKPDAAFAASGFFVGLLVLIVNPLKIMGDQRRLDRLVARGNANRCALLADAERLLIRDAASEALGKSALVHIGNFVLNIGLGLGVGLGYHHWDQAALLMLGGYAIGEAQFATQPSDVIDLLARYRAGNLSPRRAATTRAFAVAPSFTREGVSLAVAVGF
jgi:hypothetical protein